MRTSPCEPGWRWLSLILHQTARFWASCQARTRNDSPAFNGYGRVREWNRGLEKNSAPESEGAFPIGEA